MLRFRLLESCIDDVEFSLWGFNPLGTLLMETVKDVDRLFKLHGVYASVRVGVVVLHDFQDARPIAFARHRLSAGVFAAILSHSQGVSDLLTNHFWQIL